MGVKLHLCPQCGKYRTDKPEIVASSDSNNYHHACRQCREHKENQRNV